MYKVRKLGSATYIPRNYLGPTSPTYSVDWPTNADLWDQFCTAEKMSQRYFAAPSNAVPAVMAYQLGQESFRSTEYGPKRVNFCTHEKRDRLEYYGHGISNNQYKNYYRHGVYWSRYSVIDKLIVGLPSTTYYPKPLLPFQDVSSAARRAWWTMQPRFQGESNLLLSLVELKDFKDIAHNAAKLSNKLRAFGFSGKRPSISKKSAKSALDRTTETVADGVLMYNFAIRPLISDYLNLIADAQTTVADAQRAFIDKGTIPFTAHYTEVLDSTQSLEKPQTYWKHVSGSMQKLTFTASMERTYSVKPLSSYNAFMQYYGLGFSYETLWNLLPFSFLADYVLSIGKSIRAMERRDRNVNLSAISYYESVLNDSTWGVYAHNLNGKVFFPCGGVYSTTTPRFVSGYRSSHYQRYRAMINYGPALPNFAKYSDRKLLNSIALARVMF